jgi:two-component system, chemotaxis family, sensor kinase CheA
VQYRGGIMPLAFVDSSCRLRHDGRQPVLVFADNGSIMGLVVDEINDIVDTTLKIELSGQNNGRAGTAVIAGKVTEVMDVGYYFNTAFKDFFRPAEFGSSLCAGSEPRKLLLVDDSSFFRTMLKPLLQASGYIVTTAPDVATALKLREEGEIFDAIVSDIEMPGLNGFEFAQEVRSGGTWQATPMIALTSLNSATDVARGRSVGFDNYVGKFDREVLLGALDEQLGQVKNAA